MSHLYAAIAKTKHVTESSLVKDAKSCFKYSDAFLPTFYETTKQISFDSKLLTLINLQRYISFNSIYSLLTLPISTRY